MNKYDSRQRVYFPEPIKSRFSWSKIIAAQNELYGLRVNELHDDATDRSFLDALQMLVTRDGAILKPASAFTVDNPLLAVVGFDGADNFCHVLLRLIDYLDGVAVESEIKGVALAIGRYDDHNPNLELLFARLGPEINAYID